MQHATLNPNRTAETLAEIQQNVRARVESGEAGMRRYELLADELRDRILSGDLAEGVALPGEREFVQRTGLGRGSVREAIRILESEALLSPKSPGRYGQSVVLPVSGKGVQRQLEFFIRGGAISSDDLVEVRLAIEPPLARLAAQNRNQEDLQRLRAILTTMHETPLADRRTLKRLNFDWHVAMAKASHNELLRAFLSGITSMHDRANNMEVHGTDDTTKAMIAALERIQAAIEARDAETAMQRMARHLQAYADGLGRMLPEEIPLEATD
ncbi:FCD domain-containing protein [Pseudooceanicola sp.]|uniref:FadR/GntR family transcriptional regulator n=1 Tax=Pseudooceanicola sp. TaxID=1914328 RepID=UPI0026320138|nr:FCD domain-containing protein [Pseudooceanicola sp.]MDF1856433.1 FCD domain-containing protein [Pseudooceanicola sp.]